MSRDIGDRIIVGFLDVIFWVAVILLIAMFVIQHFFGDDLMIYRQERMKEIDASRNMTEPAKAMSVEITENP